MRDEGCMKNPAFLPQPSLPYLLRSFKILERQQKNNGDGVEETVQEKHF
jgi:hypothetical protein